MEGERGGQGTHSGPMMDGTDGLPAHGALGSLWVGHGWTNEGMNERLKEVVIMNDGTGRDGKGRDGTDEWAGVGMEVGGEE